jgi:hypothetical protein
MLSEDEIVELCAKAQHEVTRIYSYALGTPMPEALDLLWGELDDNLQEVARTLVDHVLKGERDPAKLHVSWVTCMLSIGWVWGTSIFKKEHPWLMDYEELPVPQRIRMDLVVSVTVGVASRYGFLV